MTDGFDTGARRLLGPAGHANGVAAVTVAGCYEDLEIHAEVRAQTSADAEQIDEMRS